MCKRASSQCRRILVVRARTSRTSIAGYMSVSRRDPSRGVIWPKGSDRSHPRRARGQPTVPMPCQRTMSRSSRREYPPNGGIAKGRIIHEMRTLMTNGIPTMSRRRGPALHYSRAVAASAPAGN